MTVPGLLCPKSKVAICTPKRDRSSAFRGGGRPRSAGETLPAQEFHHNLPEAILAIRKTVIAIREKMELYIFIGATNGEIGDVSPRDGGVALALEEEAGGAVAGEQGFAGVSA